VSNCVALYTLYCVISCGFRVSVFIVYRISADEVHVLRSDRGHAVQMTVLKSADGDCRFVAPLCIVPDGSRRYM